MMSKEKPVTVDFKQKGDSERILNSPPLLSSHCSGWSGIHLEHHCSSHDTPEHHITSHIVCIGLNTTQVENWLDDRFQRYWVCSQTIGIIPAYALHRSVTIDPCDFLLLAVEQPFLNNVAQEWIDPARIQLIPYFNDQQDPLILEMGMALKRELESGCLGGRVYGDSAATMLAVHLLRHYSICKQPIREYTGGLPPHKLKQAIAYIQDHLSEDISLEAISNEIGISQYYFSRLFKQSLGIPPHKYINQQRIERAKQLLKDPKLAIADVALQCGYFDHSHFTKYFRRFTGVTPKAYREQ